MYAFNQYYFEIMYMFWVIPLNIYIYIYIYRERERGGEKWGGGGEWKTISWSMLLTLRNKYLRHTHIYIWYAITCCTQYDMWYSLSPSHWYSDWSQCPPKWYKCEGKREVDFAGVFQWQVVGNRGFILEVQLLRDLSLHLASPTNSHS